MTFVTRQIVQVGGAVLILLSLAAFDGVARAGENATSQESPYEHFFDGGRYEAAITSGVLFSPFGPTRMRPTINYTISGFQIGYMLWDVKGDGWWRGNLEIAGEVFGSAIFDGPGSYIAGGTLWLRYNFVPPSSSAFVPYLQVGGGGESTDVDHEVVGQPFNFNLNVGAGVRYFIGRSWSLSLEFRYQHISNAYLSKHNLGINSAGPILGISYFF
jgi:lipid A 3-O-deacylase